jgi:hypothetical protein
MEVIENTHESGRPGLFNKNGRFVKRASGNRRDACATWDSAFGASCLDAAPGAGFAKHPTKSADFFTSYSQA